MCDDLARRFATAASDALRDVISAYAGPMMTVAMRCVGNDRRLAEEVVQQSFLNAWRAAGSFDPARPLGPWLFSIVRRCAIDVWRREHRHQREAGSELDDRRMGAVADRGDTLADAWLVRSALDALPLDEHAILRLTYFEGLTQGEVATRLAIPVGTVKSRSARAHRRLRERLRAELVVA